ncbi:hypothetical protein P2318_06050 [Myxococcaceae bacterium GXIMD 01537]
MTLLRTPWLALCLFLLTPLARAAETLTLSALEPVEGGCEWVQLEPLAASRRVIARLPADCQGGGTALSKDGQRGAVRFWRGAVSAPAVGRPSFPESMPSPAFRDRLFVVDVAAGRAEEVALPPLGELIEYGFDARGRLLGLSLQAVTPAQLRAGTARVEDSELRLDVWGPARPVLAHAFVYEGGAWARVESRAATDVTGVRALTPWKTLGERSSRSLEPRFEPGELDDALLDGLYALSPELPEGEWGLLRRGGVSLAVWGTPQGETLLATGLLRLIEKGRAIALPEHPFRENDLVGVQTRGPLLLVSLADSGGHPRLYRGRKLLWQSERARAVSFWPR